MFAALAIDPQNETGIWKATELVKFNSYGIAPGALLRGNQKFKSFGLFPMGLDILAGTDGGGLALLRIQLVPDAGKPKEAFFK